ncbi:MAG: hypothetical protein HY861_00430 [Chlamydiia bacterium]|nr:hypothetical protein [Chlamydiia bacterium]
MKDLPHHMKQLNRRVLRSLRREETVEEISPDTTGMPRKQTIREQKKNAKRQTREERLSRTPVHASMEERNQAMKHRVPIFDRNNAKPKSTRSTKKKTPRI